MTGHIRTAPWIVAAVVGLALTAAPRAAPLQRPATATAPAPYSPAERAAVERALLGASAHGLGAPNPAADDAGLTAQIMEYVRAQWGGRVNPRQAHREWGITLEPAPELGALAAARASGGLQAFIDRQPPPHPGYQALLPSRAHYAELAASGGWNQIPAGPALREGDGGPRVEQLRRRLAREGYASSLLTAPDGFDTSLDFALRRYQTARGLEVDGVAGVATLAALNVSASERLAQIDANLERWRWLPRDLPAERIEVDIAAAEAVYFAGGRPALSMKVVVGAMNTPTPLFYSAIHSIVLNPPWNVPDSIARNEILPRAARDPAYLSRNRFTYSGGRLVQAPGAASALGLFKFDFDSPYGVYLHDTPGKAAFQRRERFLSHGCVRLEKPRELAVMLLERQGLSADETDAMVAAGTTRRVTLDRRVPLFMTYRTVQPRPDGPLVFLPDTYGWDSALSRALTRAAAPQALAAAPSSDCEDR